MELPNELEVAKRWTCRRQQARYALPMSNERFEHRRQGDGELLGWIEERGEGFVAVDHFGWERTGIVDWFDAESVLDDLGLSYLAARYVYSADDGRILDVRIAEVREGAVVIKEEDAGAIGMPQIFYTLRTPVDPKVLRLR